MPTFVREIYQAIYQIPPQTLNPDLEKPTGTESGTESGTEAPGTSRNQDLEILPTDFILLCVMATLVALVGAAYYSRTTFLLGAFMTLTLTLTLTFLLGAFMKS